MYMSSDVAVILCPLNLLGSPFSLIFEAYRASIRDDLEDGTEDVNTRV